MRQYQVAVGTKAQFDGPWWAVRCILADSSGLATVSLDDGPPLPLFGAYTIPADPDRPFMKVVVVGNAVIQLAESAGEDLSGGVTVPQGASPRREILKQVIAGNMDFDTGPLPVNRERGLLLLSETTEAGAGNNRKVFLDWYNDDGSILQEESGNFYDLGLNGRHHLLVAEQVPVGAASAFTDGSGVFDGIATGAGGSFAVWGALFHPMMGLHIPAGLGVASWRFQVWL